MQSATVSVIEKGVWVAAASVAGRSLRGFLDKRSHMDLFPPLIRIEIAR